MNYVGSNSCKECHNDQFSKWEKSHHFRSMNEATDEFVIGDFNNKSIMRKGQKHEMYKKDGKYYVKTDGEDGKIQEFEIKYTFGFKPIQQYLVELDRGRLQVLSLTYDTEKKYWFYMADETYKNQNVDHKDWLHWTNQAQNWNGMCADCHSTNFKKGYDYKADTYSSSFSEVNVSCESCHGPASSHIAWTKTKPKVEKKGFAFSLNQMTPHQLTDNCARCHARRTSLSDNKPGAKLLDHMVPAIPAPPSYYIDGQVNQEDFVYSSFTQTKMHKANVTCNMCHDSHSNQLKFKGDAVCTQCHAGNSYTAENHSKHKDDSASCVSCHMTGKVFMAKDFRRDHSFRIPRPDLTAKYQTPNACSSCHSTKSMEWVLKSYKKLFPKRARDSFCRCTSVCKLERSKGCIRIR